MRRQPASKAFYVTTPIYYVTAPPSIGHAYTTVAGDVLARWHRQRGERGLVPHRHRRARPEGARAAAEARRHPQEWTDRLVETAWKPVLDDDRRSQRRLHPHDRAPPHRAGAGVLADAPRRRRRLRGHLRGPVLRGLRGVQAPGRAARGRSTASAAAARSTSARSSSCREANYFFAMAEYADRLLELYETQPDVRAARERPQRGDLVRQAGPAGPVDHPVDASTGASRCRGTTKHVLYVWIDALLNYVDRGRLRHRPRDGSTRIWPADVHLVGKDILRFHAVIWPAMLMAAGLDVPRTGLRARLAAGRRREDEQVQGDRHRTRARSSTLRVRRLPLLLHCETIAFGSDGSFSWEHMSAVYTSELANGLGNLASRVTAMVGKYFDGVLPEPTRRGPAEQALADGLADDGRDGRRGDRPARASTRRSAAIGRLRRRGQRLRHRAGAVEGRQGRLARRAQARLATILYAAAESLRAVAVLHNPVMPKTVGGAVAAARRRGRSSARWPTSGSPTPAAGASCPPGATLTKGEALFPRLEPRRPREPSTGAEPRQRSRRSAPRRQRPRARPQPPAAARAAAAPGRRQPLPPRHRRRRRRWLDPASGCSSRRPRSACRGSCRSAATCRARGGRSRRRERTTRWSPASRCTPTRRRGSTAAGALDDALAEIERAGGVVASGCAPSARPGSTTSAPGRRAATAQEGSFRAHIALAQRLGQDAGDPRPRRARRRAARCSTSRACPSARCCTASPATPTSPAPASTAAPTCRSPAR